MTSEIDYTKYTRDELMSLLLKNGLIIKDFPEDLKNDWELCLYAVHNCGRALEYIQKFNDNEWMVRRSIENDGEAFIYTGSKTKDDEYRLMLAIMNHNSGRFKSIFKYASDRLKSQHYLVKKIVAINGLDLKYASDSCKDDYDIVINAIKNNPIALRYASERLRGNFILAMHAVRNDVLVYKYLPDELMRDHTIISIVLTCSPSSINLIPQDFQNNYKSLVGC